MLKDHIKTSAFTGLIIGAIISLFEGLSIVSSSHWGGFRLEGRVAPIDFSVFFYGLILYGFAGTLIGILLNFSVTAVPRIKMRLAGKSSIELLIFYLNSNMSVFLSIYAGYIICKQVASRITTSYIIFFTTVATIIGCYFAIYHMLSFLTSKDLTKRILSFLIEKVFTARKVYIYLLVISLVSFFPCILEYFNSFHTASIQEPVVSFKADNKTKNLKVILICIDALRADHLSCYGYSKYTSPNIDKLAENGTLFNNAYAQSSWTRPSVASIFTSLYPSSHGIIQLNHDWIHSRILSKKAITLAELFNNAGYYTAAFVTNPHITKKFGFDQGFDYHHFLYPKSFYALIIFKIMDKFLRMSAVRLYYHEAAALNKKAFPWIINHKKVPFFLYLHYTDPHMPYFKHPIVLGLARSNFHGQWNKENLIDLYDNEISYVDSHIGSLLSLLKEINIFDNTMIVVTSDHGEEFDDHGGYDHGITLYEEQLKVPLIIKNAMQSKTKLVDSEVALSIDIAPTILKNAEIKIPETMQGKILGASKNSNFDRSILAELGEEQKGMRSVRLGDWKLIRTHNFPNDHWNRSYPIIQLFDLKTDPGEQRNLADMGLMKLANLENELNKLVNIANENSSTAPSKTMDDALKERLRTLGYIR